MKEVFFWTLERGISLSVFLVIIFLFRNRKGEFYKGETWRRLWIGILILFLLPVSFFKHSPITLNPVRWETIHEQAGETVTYAEEKKKNPILKETGTSIPEQPEQKGITGIETFQTEEEMRREIRDSLLVENRADVADIFTLIWICGVFITFLWATAKEIWWRKNILSKNQKVKDTQLLEMVRNISREVGINVPALYQNPLLRSPILVGTFSRRIVIPEKEYREEKLRWAIYHECVHGRKQDILIRGAWAVFCWIFWYQPVVWIAKRCMLEDLEIACDESVLRGKDEQSFLSYSYALLAFIRPGNKGGGTSLAFSVEKERMKLRFSRIFSKEAKKNGKRFLAVMLCTGFLCSGLISCGKTEKADFRETEKLVIAYDDTKWGDGQLSESAQYINNVVAYYKAAHPEVEVILKGMENPGDSVEGQGLDKKFKTEIMAGKGPDLVLCTGSDLIENPEKQMEMGLFCDLNPYLEKSEELSPEILNEKVLGAGEYENKQYLMPLNYHVYHLVSGKNQVEQAGFSEENCKDRNGFIKETEKFYNATKESFPLTQAYLYPDGTVNGMFQNSFPALFPDFFESEILPFEEEEIKNWFLLYQKERTLQQKYAKDYEDSFCGESYLWEPVMDGNVFYVRDVAILEEDKLTVLPLSSNGEGMTAVVNTWAGILSGAENKKNAWDFIELMLSYNGQKLTVRDNQLPVRTDLDKEILSYWETNYMADYSLMAQGEKEKLRNQVLHELKDISEAVLSKDLYMKILEYFEPFVTGEESYETCCEKAQQYYNIYCSE